MKTEQASRSYTGCAGKTQKQLRNLSSIYFIIMYLWHRVCSHCLVHSSTKALGWTRRQSRVWSNWMAGIPPSHLLTPGVCLRRKLRWKLEQGSDLRVPLPASSAWLNVGSKCSDLRVMKRDIWHNTIYRNLKNIHMQINMHLEIHKIKQIY